MVSVQHSGVHEPAPVILECDIVHLKGPAYQQTVIPDWHCQEVPSDVRNRHSNQRQIAEYLSQSANGMDSDEMRLEGQSAGHSHDDGHTGPAK
jgi:hypothetical protein